MDAAHISDQATVKQK